MSKHTLLDGTFKDPDMDVDVHARLWARFLEVSRRGENIADRIAPWESTSTYSVTHCRLRPRKPPTP